MLCATPHPRLVTATLRRASHRARLIRCLSTPNGGQPTTDLDAIIVLAGRPEEDFVATTSIPQQVASAMMAAYHHGCTAGSTLLLRSTSSSRVHATCCAAAVEPHIGAQCSHPRALSFSSPLPAQNT